MATGKESITFPRVKLIALSPCSVSGGLKPGNIGKRTLILQGALTCPVRIRIGPYLEPEHIERPSPSPLKGVLKSTTEPRKTRLRSVVCLRFNGHLRIIITQLLTYPKSTPTKKPRLTRGFRTLIFANSWSISPALLSQLLRQSLLLSSRCLRPLPSERTQRFLRPLLSQRHQRSGRGSQRIAGSEA